MKHSFIPVLILSLSAASMPATSNAELRLDTYNGATCIPYPAFDTTVAVPNNNFLYGFRQVAYCHFTVPNTWSADQIAYVLFEGGTSNFELMRVRLCVYSGTSYSCGTERTISGSNGVNWVAPPAPMPPFVTGGYLSVRFPNGAVSVFTDYQPTWYRPTIVPIDLPETADLAVARLGRNATANMKWQEGLRSGFNAEPRIDSWARAKEATLRDAAMRIQAVPDDMLRSIECRQTRCRAQARIATSIDGKALQERLQSIGQWAESDSECEFTILQKLDADGQGVELLTRCDARRAGP